ncbi:MAG TPA: GNAT family N-acetyltransferase [Nocardioidaceae bacterium]|nr:GNAT family N-acetyltransferase [Nocardioidaceae bacterium]
MSPTSSNPPGLGPHVVGQRVVVRRVLRGETGPTGGPAFTDVLGVMEAWSSAQALIRTAGGDLVTIEVADIVSGKPVPPRPPVRMRVSPEVAERRALASWPAIETERLGDWVLRASAGYSSRANSVLAVDDPGVPLEEALERVEAFYAAHGLRPWAQAVVGSDTQVALESAGWVLARPGEADTLFQLVSVSSALRSVRRSLPPVVPAVQISSRVDAVWLADDLDAQDHREPAVAILEGPTQVGFVSVLAPGSSEVVAKGRVARGAGAVPGDEDWVGITNVWVSPDHRRERLGTVVMGAMLEWAAERGATTAYLQVRGDNAAGLAAYDRLGFTTHHAYRYLTTP